MIPKIICFLFGHKFFENIFTGEYGRMFNNLYGKETIVPITCRTEQRYCIRCGVTNLKITKHETTKS